MYEKNLYIYPDSTSTGCLSLTRKIHPVAVAYQFFRQQLTVRITFNTATQNVHAASDRDSKFPKTTEHLLT